MDQVDGKAALVVEKKKEIGGQIMEGPQSGQSSHFFTLSIMAKVQKGQKGH
jgi:hypothetical protein